MPIVSVGALNPSGSSDALFSNVGGWVTDYAQSVTEAVADLEKALETGRSRLDPETVSILEDNLRTIDQAIDQARKALRADPANAYLNNHFAASRNRKLALLRRASALAMSGDSMGGS